MYSMNGYLSAEVDFEKGEHYIRKLVESFELGPIIKYLPFHFTLFYGLRPNVSFEPFLSQFSDSDNPLYTRGPVPLGLEVFSSDKYHALVIKYDFPAAKEVNTAISWSPSFNKLSSPHEGFNCEKFSAIVTIGYIDPNVNVDEIKENIKSLNFDLEDFLVKIKGISVEFDMKPQPKLKFVNEDYVIGCNGLEKINK